MRKELINDSITYRLSVCFQASQHCDNMELDIKRCSTIGPDCGINMKEIALLVILDMY